MQQRFSLHVLFSFLKEIIDSVNIGFFYFFLFFLLEEKKV